MLIKFNVLLHLVDILLAFLYLIFHLIVFRAHCILDKLACPLLILQIHNLLHVFEDFTFLQLVQNELALFVLIIYRAFNQTVLYRSLECKFPFLLSQYVLLEHYIVLQLLAFILALLEDNKRTLCDLLLKKFVTDLCLSHFILLFAIFERRVRGVSDCYKLVFF